MTVDMHTYTNPEPRPDPVSQNRTQTRLVEPEPDPNPTVGKARLNPDPTFRTDPVGSIGSDHRPKPKTGSEPGFGQHYASTLDAGQDVRPDAAFLEPLDQVERCLWVFLSCILHSLSCACFGGKPGR
ncbi:hypothetical protein BCR44DRAFT_60090 [Catenaria anguillulae PL171]|uniref:Uncharacterized protein n=1 Tax=Catenaria anguillulae PL171 TaxID=765915 RepID=A0A1Y2H1Z8_9FUNG|nr:hypothetical protein BCR44DRAFT_60090 [Catenaria anguillulae PL171]